MRLFRNMRLFCNLVLGTLGLAGGVLILQGARSVRENLKGDPLASFRAPKTPLYPDSLGLRLTDVRVRRYVGTKIETEFKVAQVDVERNRNVFAMTGIHDGVYRPTDDKTGDGGFRFAAGAGRYNGYMSHLDLQKRVTVKGKEYDLASNALTYDGIRKTLTIANSVRGTAWGGEVRAERVNYDVERKAFTSGPAMWRGKIPARYLASMGLPASMQNTLWKVQTENQRTEQNGRVLVFNDVLLSDKDQIVKAAKAVWDKTTDTTVFTSDGKTKVRYWSGKANCVADKVTILRREKRAILEGEVRMLVKTKAEEAEGPVVEDLPPYTALPPDKVAAGKALPKPTDIERVRSGKSVRDYPLVMVGTKVDYNYAKGSRLAVVTGSPQARQELSDGAWRQVWTNNARYDAENEILRLNGTKGKGDARMKNSVGDDLTANWFELSTAEGEDEYSGEAIRGVVTTTDDEDVPKNGAGKTPPPTGGPPPPGTTPPPTDGGKKPPRP